MNQFTHAVLAHMLRDKDTKDTVLAWFAAEADPVKRAVAFAGVLGEDLEDGDSVSSLADRLVAEAFRHVNFRQFAEELLRRFDPVQCRKWSVPLGPSRN